MYGIFILNSATRQWKMVEAFASRAAADQELAYLRDVLGVDARLFFRP